MRETEIQIGGTIFNKSVQVLAYADDVDIIGRSYRAMEEAFLALEHSARRIGLIVNEEKTKYLAADTDRRLPMSIPIGRYTFESVDHFTYLGSQVNINNNITAEIACRIVAANRCYFGLKRQLCSRLVSRKTKCLMYKSLIRPILTYGSETWSFSRADEDKLLIFERKILRRIYGPVRSEEGWRRRTNLELASLYAEINVVKFIKLGRLRWAGHVARMREDDMPKKLMSAQPLRVRRVGRPRLRWVDCVAEDSRVLLGVRDWRTAAQERESWARRIEEARTQQ